MKITHSLAILSILAIAVSCAKETPAEENAVRELVEKTFTAGSSETKTHVDGTSILWDADDQIAVFDNIAPSTAHIFTLKEGEGTASASFTGEVSKGATAFWAVYPASAAKGVDTANDRFSITLPAAQKLGGRNISNDALVCVAKADGDALSMKNAFGYLKVEVTYDNITLIRLNGTGLSGDAIINASGALVSGPADATSVSVSEEGEDAVIAPGVYYIPVLPGITPAGSFSIDMERADGFTASRTSTKEITIGRNGGTTTGKLDANPDYHWSIHITNTEELLAWNENAAKWRANDYVYLDADVSLSGEGWTANNFPGKFYGQNHAITDINLYSEDSDVNFFRTVSGSIQDLKFGSETDESTFECKAATGTLYVCPIRNVSSGGQLTNISNYATVNLSGTSGYYIGGICGSYGSAKTVSGLKNYGLVESTGSPSTIINIGGVFAQIGTNTTVEDCHNYGEVKYAGVTQTAGTYNFGGVIGYTNSTSTITGCTNEGALSVANTFTAAGDTHNRLGGIIGYWNTNAGTITGCVNKGTISNNAKTMSGKRNYIGGIIGQTTVTLKIYDCINEGKLSNTTTATYIYMGGMVGFDNGGATIGSEEQPCVNKAAVANTGKSSNGSENTQSNISVAGIVGLSDKASKISFCVNEAAISDSGALSFIGNIKANGGLVGTMLGGGQITDCTNKGTVSVSSKSSKTARCYTGGIIGYCYKTAANTFANNLNDTTAVVTMSGSYVFENNIGGIAGYVNGVATGFSGCTNCAKITNTADRAAVDSLADGTKAPLQCFGGIVGKTTGAADITGCSNSGQIYNNDGIPYYSGTIMGGIAGIAGGAGTYSGCTNTGFIYDLKGVNAAGLTISLGGIIGQATAVVTVTGNCVNSGVVEKSTGGNNPKIYLGGIVGSTTVAGLTINECKNLDTGTIDDAGATSGNAFIGGILGQTAKTVTITKCSNAAVVKIRSDAGYGYAGGIVGTLSNGSTGSVVSECRNSGDINVTSTIKNGLRMGGIAGDAYGKHTFTDNINSGNVSNTSPTVKDIRIGGVDGSNTSTGSVFTRCKNFGNVSSSTTGTTAVTVAYLGGVSSYIESKTQITDCENYGDVSITSESTITKLYIAGIGGYCKASALSITGCKTNCAVSGSATTLYAGEVIGYGVSSVINTTGLAGSVNGTTIDDGNWMNKGILYGTIGTSTAGVNVSGDANSCYLLTEAKPGLGTSNFTSRNDSNLW